MLSAADRQASIQQATHSHVVGIHDFTGQNVDEISFSRGDLILGN